MRNHTLFSFSSSLRFSSGLLDVVIHPLPNSTVTCLNARTWPLADERSAAYYLISMAISLHAPLPSI